MKNFLLFNDLCGFKNIAMNSSAEALLDLYALYLTSTVMPSDRLNISTMIMSDTLLATPIGAENLFSRICMYASNEGFAAWHRIMAGASALPIRGSLAYDELLFGLHNVSTQALGRPQITKPSSQLLLGKSVILCYEHEKNQDWYCTSIVPENLETIQTTFSDQYSELLTAGYLVEWDIPLKGNKSIRGAVINSFYSWHYDDLRARIIQNLGSADSDIKFKYRNTLDFYDFCKSKRIIPGFPSATT